jgi:hypothetical protein
VLKPNNVSAPICRTPTSVIRLFCICFPRSGSYHQSGPIVVSQICFLNKLTFRRMIDQSIRHVVSRCLMPPDKKLSRLTELEFLQALGTENAVVRVRATYIAESTGFF